MKTNNSIHVDPRIWAGFSKTVGKKKGTNGKKLKIKEVVEAFAYAYTENRDGIQETIRQTRLELEMKKLEEQIN